MNEHETPKRLKWEVAIIVLITLGQSAIYSVLRLIRAALAPTPIGQQQASLNPRLADQAFWDVLYQALSVFFSLTLVALVLYLLWPVGGSAFKRIGLTFKASDWGWGVALAALIGIPGIGVYVLGRELGMTVALVASPLDAAWYTIPLLLLSALRAGLLEEVVGVGYLVTRLRQIGWGIWPVVLASAALRGLYHAYQGVPGIIGNFAMGIIFAWFFVKKGRVMPLVIAHTLIDTAAFVGYPLAAGLWPGVFGAPG